MMEMPLNGEGNSGSLVKVNWMAHGPSFIPDHVLLASFFNLNIFIFQIINSMKQLLNNVGQIYVPCY